MSTLQSVGTGVPADFIWAFTNCRFYCSCLPVAKRLHRHADQLRQRASNEEAAIPIAEAEEVSLIEASVAGWLAPRVV